MRKFAIAAFCVLSIAFLSVNFVFADSLKSGPQVGEELAGPFHPLNINGEDAGKKQCLYCKNGNNPVAMIFAREVTPGLSKLIEKIDAATEKNASAHMGSFVVFLSDDQSLENKLKELAEKQHLKQ